LSNENDVKETIIIRRNQTLFLIKEHLNYLNANSIIVLFIYENKINETDLFGNQIHPKRIPNLVGIN